MRHFRSDIFFFFVILQPDEILRVSKVAFHSRFNLSSSIDRYFRYGSREGGGGEGGGKGCSSAIEDKGSGEIYSPFVSWGRG